MSNPWVIGVEDVTISDPILAIGDGARVEFGLRRSHAVQLHAALSLALGLTCRNAVQDAVLSALREHDQSKRREALRDG